jgi:DNA polymerase-1
VKTLESLDVPFVKDYLSIEKLKKLQSTYLKGIKREVVDGFLHPFFDLHLARSHRPSSSRPNFQNIPIRDPLIGKLIRSCFIPRKDHVLVEIDYSALEFKIAACFWRDDSMVAYASDPNLDIHRDMASECYRLDVDNVLSTARFFAKNQFVFPILYGSYYGNCAKNLWKESKGLSCQDGMPLQEHLSDMGMARYQDFEEHIQNVEREFNVRFPTWSSRKEQWRRDYVRDGYFDLMTGFRCSGVYSINQLMNTPIQGPAFHCLLWCLIELVKWMIKKKMKSKVIGQIHDSIIADVHRSELDDFIQKARELMTRDIRRVWDWIIVPLDVDVETSETNWFEMHNWKSN